MPCRPGFSKSVLHYVWLDKAALEGLERFTPPNGLWGGLIMLERQMEEAVASCPGLFIEPGLTLIRRQVVINGRPPDVLFSDAFFRHLLVEIQCGRLDEGHLQRLARTLVIRVRGNANIKGLISASPAQTLALLQGATGCGENTRPLT